MGDEQVWPVSSLDVVAGTGSAAAELFVERSRAIAPRFSMTDEADAVVDICQRLDGIPLAIELAASRMQSMTVTELRDRLDDRFRLLVGSRRGLARHQTLRHAVGWSYDLLDETEKTLLARCSVFAGGFDLTAACAVGGCGDDLTTLDVLDALVRKSLLVADRSSGRTRFSVLETIRQFAEEQLVASGEATEVRAAHARYFAGRETDILALWDSARVRTTRKRISMSGRAWSPERAACCLTPLSNEQLRSYRNALCSARRNPPQPVRIRSSYPVAGLSRRAAALARSSAALAPYRLSIASGAPAQQAHQVALLAAVYEEVMGVGVPEPVGVHCRRVEARAVGTHLQSLADAVGGEPATLPEEQRGAGRGSVLGPCPQVSVDGQARLRPVVSVPGPAALASHAHGLPVEVEVGEVDSGHSDTRIPQSISNRITAASRRSTNVLPLQASSSAVSCSSSRIGTGGGSGLSTVIPASPRTGVYRASGCGWSRR